MTVLTQASHQWATRPADERFVSLLDLQAHVRSQRQNSVQAVLPNRRLSAAPVEGDTGRKALVLMDNKTDQPSNPTHFAFGQLAQRLGIPAGYLRTLPADLAADCVNYGIVTRDVEEIGLLGRRDPSGFTIPDVAAVTGPNYGRVWNAEIVDTLVKHFGDGLTGAFKVPGEFGQDVPVTKANTTLYAGDRDMFVFLADEKNRIEVPNRRNGQSGSLARGFFVWNSEVGSATLGVAAFTFDYVCCNRMVWGVDQFKEVKIRHTSGAPDRWLEQITPALEQYANSSAVNIQQAIKDAQARKLEDRVDEFLATRFTKSQAKAIALAHEVEEGRPIETLWDITVGATDYAKSIEFQDERVDIERKAGEFMKLAA
jgi:hypothetical protein